MASLAERSRKILQTIVRSTTQLRCSVIIPSSHVDIFQEEPVKPFVADEHYFQVRINEMYLVNSRELFKEYRPLVFAVSEYDYGKPTSETVTVPIVVGPSSSMVSKFNLPAPDDIVFTNKTIAGLHPYIGGAINISVMLYKVSPQDYARQLLQLVENVASVVDISTAYTTYLKLASVLLDGIEGLFGLQDTVSLLGWNNNINPDANDRLEPYYAALIDMPESSIDPHTLWVCENKLRQGKSCEESRPFREANYVLYQLVQTTDRSDIAKLSFNDLYIKMREAANKRDDDEYSRAKALMTTLAVDMLYCADLTERQREKLEDRFQREMQRMHDTQMRGTTAGPGEKKALTEFERKLRETAKILDL